MFTLSKIVIICIWSFTRNYSIFHLTHVPLMDTFTCKLLVSKRNVFVAAILRIFFNQFCTTTI